MDMDWTKLGFAYMPTHSFLRYTWRDGAWDEGHSQTDPHINIHIAATALHYGQSVFEGLKAFACKDGQVRIFRPQENAARLEQSARRFMMPSVPDDMFISAVIRAVQENIDYVPPYGTGGAMYIRPLLFGTGPQIGVRPADEYELIVLVVPVGDYYKGGLNPVSAIVLDEYDRAAPRGVGHVKAAGNYAADLLPNRRSRDMGFPITLYLDAREQKYVEEFGTSNFIAITKDNKYVTPESPSILKSITNKTLMTLAEDDGMTVECRPVLFDEIAGFAELGACGTAVVITPVNQIRYGDRTIQVGPKTGCGPVLHRLYDRVRAIQTGDLPDTFGWNVDV